MSQTQTGTSHLLNREPSAGYLHEWTQRIAARKPAETRPTKAVLVFRIGSEWLGLPLSIFQEVAKNSILHTIPHRRDAVVAGVTTIRGELLVCVSLAELLGIAPAERPASTGPGWIIPQLLVANRNGNRLGLPVDEINGVLRYDDAELIPPPATLAHAAVAFTTGLAAWKHGTVACLDEAKFFGRLDEVLR